MFFHTFGYNEHFCYIIIFHPVLSSLCQLLREKLLATQTINNVAIFFFSDLKVRYKVYKRPPLIYIISQTNSIHTIPFSLRSVLILSFHLRQMFQVVFSLPALTILCTFRISFILHALSISASLISLSW
jgi:hypothetical protein